MPLVTVLLPVYNGEQFLAEAIKSVLRQTFSDFELLIVDDGSVDRTSNILRTFTDSRIRIFQNEKRQKLSGALNRGLDNAKGKYIARMDADDVCLPRRLEKQVRFMQYHPEVGICGGWVRTFGNHTSSGKVFKYPLTSEEIKATLVFDNPLAHPTVMISRDLLNKFGLRFNGSYYPAEDYDLWSRALEFISAANLAEVLLNYQLHPASMTLSGIPEMDAQACRILKPKFMELGIEASDADLAFHRYICTNRLAPDWREDSVDKTERWLVGLVKANNSTDKYDRYAFLKAARRAWFSVCYRSLEFGWPVIRRHLVSELNDRTHRNSWRNIVLMYAMLKRRLLGLTLLWALTL